MSQDLASLRAALATIQAPWNPVTVHSARADVMGVADEKFGLLASVTSPTVAHAIVAAVNALVPEDRGGGGLLEQVDLLAALQWFHDEVSAVLARESGLGRRLMHLRPILDLRADPRYEPIRAARKEGA